MRMGFAVIAAVLIAFAGLLMSAAESRAGGSLHFGVGTYSWGGHHHGHWRHHRHHHPRWHYRYHRHRHYDYDEVEPGPVTARPAAPVAADPSAPEPYCREYTTTVVVDGAPHEAYGTACRQADGSWKIIDSSAPLQF